MKNPDFHLPTTIYIEPDLISNSAQIIGSLGKRVLIITTSTDFQLFPGPLEKIVQDLKSNDINTIIFDDLPSEPSTEDIDLAVAFARKTNCDMIVGYGGIFSINSARAVALLSNNHIFSYDLLNRGEKVKIDLHPPVPLLTCPTWPVYGFEIAPLFFLNEIETMHKRSFFHRDLYPVSTLIDPAIAVGIGEEMSMKSGIALLAIAMEVIVSKRNNDIVNTFALKAIDFTFRNLGKIYTEPENVTSRSQISTASVMSGIAFSTSYSSLSLGISMALSSLTNISLENAMCILLPHIMEYNLTASPGKYVQMSKVMGEDVKEITVIEAAIKAVEAVRKLESDLSIPHRLSAYDIPKESFRSVADLAITYPFVENGPRTLSASEIETILIAAY